MTPIVLIVAVVAMNAAGDYFLKLASGKPGALGTAEFALGAGCYGISAIGVVFALRTMPVSVLGIWYSILSVLFLVALGIVVFGERLHPREIMGLVLALVSLALMRRLI